MLAFLLFDVQTRMRGQIGIEFNQESTGDVKFFLALLLADQWEAENANFLLSDLQTRLMGQNGVEFDQEFTGDVGFFPALLLADQWKAENANFLDHGPRHVLHL